MHFLTNDKNCLHVFCRRRNKYDTTDDKCFYDMTKHCGKEEKIFVLVTITISFSRGGFERATKRAIVWYW